MEIIRSVETIRGKIRITFESSWQVWLRRNEDPGFPLTEGTAVDRESFLAYIRIHQYPPALDHAVRMLAERSCSRREIERKLTLARFDPDVTDLVLFKLEKENLLNDREFAMQWVHSRSQKYGASRIRQELRTKGIDEDIASELRIHIMIIESSVFQRHHFGLSCPAIDQSGLFLPAFQQSVSFSV